MQGVDSLKKRWHRSVHYTPHLAVYNFMTLVGVTNFSYLPTTS